MVDVTKLGRYWKGSRSIRGMRYSYRWAVVEMKYTVLEWSKR